MERRVIQDAWIHFGKLINRASRVAFNANYVVKIYNIVCRNLISALERLVHQLHFGW